jgi:type I restriction enzyme, S subunit
MALRKGKLDIKWYFGKMIKIPTTWKYLRLEELISTGNQGVNTAIDTVEYVNNGYPLLKAGDIRQRFNLEMTDKISKKSFEKIPGHQKPRKGDILYANIGSQLGTAMYVDFDSEAVIAWNIFLIRVKNGIDARFLCYYLNFEMVRTRLLSMASFSTMPFISKPNLFSVRIVQPQLEEQKIIVSILSKVDELIQKVELIIEQTQRLKNGLMQKLLTQGIGHENFKTIGLGGQITTSIPVSWREVQLANLSNQGSQNGIAISVSDYGKGVPIVGMTDLFNNDILDFTKLKEVSLTKDIPKFSLKEGDLLFARRSLNVEGAGKCVLVPKVFKPIVFESSIIRMSINNELAVPRFIHFLLNSHLGRRIMTRIVKVVAVSGITGSDLRKLRIPVPSTISEQRIIVSILDSFDVLITGNKLYKANIENLKKGLMQKLLTGKIRVKV